MEFPTFLNCTQIPWFTKVFDVPEVFNEHNLRELYDRLDGCLNGMALLEEWIDFRTARENCYSFGLGEAVAAIENSNVPVENTDGIDTPQK